MDPSGTLLTLSEVAIAVAGFTAVVIAIRPLTAGTNPVLYRWSLQYLTASVAAALFFAVLPLPMLALEFDPRLVWAVSSSLLAAGNLAIASWAATQQRRRFGSIAIDGDWPVLGAFAALYAISVIVSVLNVLGLVFDREFGGYLLPLLIWFAYPLFAFFLLILRSRDPES